MRFHSTVQLDGKTATGVPVPDEVVAALGGGNRPQVRVTLAGYSYRTTVARMRGQFKFPVSAEVRDRAKIAAGDELDIEIELDISSREVAVPPELAEALGNAPGAQEAFEQLSYSSQKRYALAVERAKTPETRQRRIDKVVHELRSGR
jgi:hypothetical protein